MSELSWCCLLCAGILEIRSAVASVLLSWWARHDCLHWLWSSQVHSTLQCHSGQGTYICAVSSNAFRFKLIQFDSLNEFRSICFLQVYLYRVIIFLFYIYFNFSFMLYSVYDFNNKLKLKLGPFDCHHNLLESVICKVCQFWLCVLSMLHHAYSIIS